MSLISLHHADIVMSYRENSSDRAQNLYAILQHYAQTYCDYSVLLIEGDREPKFDHARTANQNVAHHFFQDDGPFFKAFLYNMGAKLSSSRVIWFNDIDCVLDPNTVASSVSSLLANERLDIVYPYNETIDVAGAAKAEFMQNPSFDCFVGVNGAALRDGMIRTGGVHAGGIKICKRQSYIDVGGLHLDMKGWGWEDIEFYTRAVRLGLQCTAAAAPLFHLQHDTIVRDFDAPDALRNKALKEQTETMPHSDLLELVERLKLFTDGK